MAERTPPDDGSNVALNESTPEDARVASAAVELLEDRELVSEFIIEANEHIQSIENNLLLLESEPANTQALQSVFRSFHSVKGLAGFFDLPILQEVSHEVENLLSMARDQTRPVDSSLVDVVLEGADFIKRTSQRLEARMNGAALVPEDSSAELLARIHAWTAEPNQHPDPQSHPIKDPNSGALAQEGIPSARSEGAAPVDAGSGSETGVRVHISKLDYLVDMVGELVIAQSMLHLDPDLISTGSSRVTRNLAQLRRITGEIQKTAMAMRMIPVRQLFKRMARVVRDLARKIDKQVELEISGEETELDRTIIEELVDALMHMIRNSVDHGIESAADRAAANKPECATIHLKAYHQGGHIVIEVTDDGRGIDRQKVIKRALAAGILSAGTELTESEAFQMIFQPGFSTAAQVTEVSGRGVGLDVVRKHVEKLRGRIQIESVLGVGTTFLLKLPLTLAIVDGLVVGVGSERYVIPIFAVREVLRPTASMILTVQNRGEMAAIRDALLPVVRLHRCFGVTPASESATDGILVVSDSGGKRFCLLVDRLMGKQEVVIKGLGDNLKDIPGITGSAILGDGHVGLILDMEGLCHDHAA